MRTAVNDTHQEAIEPFDVMVEAARCRERARADERIAAAANLDHVRTRHLISAAVWKAQAERLDRAAARRRDAIAAA